QHHSLVDRKGPAAHPARHQLGDVGVDGDDLDADSDPGDEAPQQEAARRGLARHDDGRCAVEQQRVSEDGLAPVTIGEEAEAEGADEQAGESRRDEGADAGEAEEGLRRRGHQPAAREARRDIAGEEQIVDFEATAEREQNHQPPDIAGRRQRLEPS
ncbi:hypothetical protein chiPu_0033376, partial [Chiloscyllium punctatum]|nr:hypothetical protein [Chiloscyllium punctatum]